MALSLSRGAGSSAGDAMLASHVLLANFLETHRLHKKELAELIGVTLSYVYNLLDPEAGFSSRQTTLERIATVMDLPVSQFPEYRATAAEETTLPSHSQPHQQEGVAFLKQRQQELGLSNLEVFRRMPSGYRLATVDLWRGAVPFPLDWAWLGFLAQVFVVSRQALYPFWELRLAHYLDEGGFHTEDNSALWESIQAAVRQHF